MTINIQKQNEETLRKLVLPRTYDSYCDLKTWEALVKEGTGTFKLDTDVVTAVIETELDSRGIANEKKLLEELDGMLHRFTDADKKLDNKEREDAIQYVCKVRAGYTKGLNFKIADKHVTDFCKANRVKVKTGLFSWDVPK